MICAIVLAAGRSQRMGTQKLVLPFAGSTVVARVVDAFLGAPVDTVVVVIRADDAQVRAALTDRCLLFVENPDPAGDMLSSVRCGLRALPVNCLLTPSLSPSDGERVSGLSAVARRAKAEGRVRGMQSGAWSRGAPIRSASKPPSAASTIVVAPGDQPSLTPSLIRQMLAAFHTSGRGILVPVHQGRRGHPLVFTARFREELLTAYDGTGLRGLLQSHFAEIVEWPTPDGAVLEDLDTPEDYQRLVRPS